ncbi:MAG: tetratricopeptide repeat protein, partial [Psychrilyobacter sp.]|uniref:tetratricopeptide repeat protein n=1 Tax=Psychrilyobacter sp. TaxID=2586924 RepID=UPI003C7233F8
VFENEYLNYWDYLKDLEFDKSVKSKTAIGKNIDKIIVNLLKKSVKKNIENIKEIVNVLEKFKSNIIEEKYEGVEKRDLNLELQSEIARVSKKEIFIKTIEGKKRMESKIKDYLEGGESKITLDSYGERFDRNINDSEYFYQVGSIKKELKYYREAEKDYDEAIKLDSNNAEYYNNRGITKRCLKNYKEAILDYDKALELNPKNPIYYNNRGYSKNSLKDHEGAILDYDKALELDPKDHVYYNNRGSSKRSLEDYEGAILDYNKAIELNPKDSVYYNNRGFAKYCLGNYKEAVLDYDEALELNPNYEVAKENRANCIKKMNEAE